MNNADFKKMYDDYSDWSVDSQQLGRLLKKWEDYCQAIKIGLPIDKWLKKDKDDDKYLVYFLEHETDTFGSINLGNAENQMIYHNTGNGNKNDKYYDGYQKKYFDNRSDVEKDYEDNIRELLKKIVEAPDVDELYNLEKDNLYKHFYGKVLLRKITVMMSILDSCKYKYEFVWIYSDKVIDKLAAMLDIDTDDKTDLQKNHDVCKKAKEWAGLSQITSIDECKKLYKFLFELASDNVSELADFKNINLIFHGAPGTGKTHCVTKDIKKLQSLYPAKYKDCEYIQFHPSFTYQDFIEGIKPVGMQNGNLQLQVVNGSFKQFCIDVKKKNEEYYRKNYSNSERKPNPKNPADFADWPHYYFIVDEINRGNLSEIFGETFTLLEEGYRDYDFSGSYTEKGTNLVSTALSNVIQLGIESCRHLLIYKQFGGKVYFGIPFNIHFIGIMNDVDRSIDPFDLALRRRFKWILKECDYDVIKDGLSNYNGCSEYVENCKKLNDYICNSGLKLGKTYEIGHAFFLKIKNVVGSKKITEDAKKELFASYIEGTLGEYIRQVKDESEVDFWINKCKEAFGIKK
jgi:5-methylcytosine-specific restriction enzyme B